MLDLDLLISFSLMGLFFVRQVIIYKLPNKINYAPLVLGVGGIGAMVHLLLYPENEDFILLVRESVLPFFVGLMLFIIMNIMRQTQQQQSLVDQHDFTESLMEQVTQLKAYISVLEENQERMYKKEDSIKRDMTMVFEKEIDALHTIQKNQREFVDQLGEVIVHQEASIKGFEVFTQQEMPDLDKVIHHHIDLLRIAEQDHFNQIRTLLERADHTVLIENLESFRIRVDQLLENNKETSKEIVAQASRETRNMLLEFSKQLNALRSQTEALSTSLTEDETILSSLREQSQLVMKQLTLSAQQINGIYDESDQVRQVYGPLSDLTKEIIAIQDDYVSARARLEQMIQAMDGAGLQRLEEMQHSIEILGEQLKSSVDASMQALHEHYHIAEREISQSVKELSSKNRSRQSYQGEANT